MTLGGIPVRIGWNTRGTVTALTGAWDSRHAILLLNPATAELAPVRRWMAELGVVVEGDGPTVPHVTPGAPLLHGLPPGFQLLLLTSGTTGTPRLVALDRISVGWNVDALVDHLCLHPAPAVVLQVPVFHAFGAVLCVLLAHMSGGRVHRFHRFTAARLVEWLAGTGVDDDGDPAPPVGEEVLLPFVPAMVRSLPHPEDLPPETRSRLAAVRGTSITGGDLVAPSDLDRLSRLLPGVRHTVGYGLTEAGPVLTHTRPGDPVVPGAIGVALPAVEFFPPDPQSPLAGWRFRSPGQAVAVRTPGDSHWRSVRGERLPTGDHLDLSSEGNFTFLGRAAWSFKRAGEMISPVLIEGSLREAWRGAWTSGGGSGAAASEMVAPEMVAPEMVVVPDAGEGLALVVEGVPDKGVEAALRQSIQALPAFLRPDQIRWVARLPRNALGKVERGKVARPPLHLR